VKTMPRCLWAILILLLMVSCSPSRTGGTISDKGNLIELKTPDHTVKAVKGKKEEGSFVIMSIRPVGNPDVMKYLDARMTVMPKETFDEYKAQMEAMKEKKTKNPADLLKLRKSVRRMAVIAENGKVQNTLKKLQGQMEGKERHHALVKISMTDVMVMELMHKDKPVFLSGDLGKHYLIHSMEILQDNYAF